MHLMLLLQDSLLFHEVSKLGLIERKMSTGRMKKELPFPPMGALSPLEIRAPGKGRLTLQGMTTAARCLLPRNEVKRKRITISGRGGKPQPTFSVVVSSAFCERYGQKKQAGVVGYTQIQNGDFKSFSQLHNYSSYIPSPSTTVD